MGEIQSMMLRHGNLYEKMLVMVHYFGMWGRNRYF